jgi:mannose-6-phosphate isomerase-like protein (cupin superfamily)
MSSTLIWATEDKAPVSSMDPTPSVETYVPSSGSTRIILLKIPPDGTVDPAIDPADIYKESVETSPGIAQLFEPDGSGMHTTPTVDYVTVISGELDLDLDDGNVITLKPGETVVQLGARHAWRNHTKEPAVAVFVLIGTPAKGSRS